MKPNNEEIKIYIELCIDSFSHSDRKFEKDMIEKGKEILQRIKLDEKRKKRR